MCQPAATPLTATGIVTETCSHCKNQGIWGGGGRAGEGDLSGLPLRARLVELGLAWVGKGKARVLLGVDLKWERTDPTSLRPWPTDLRGSQADRTLGLGPCSRQVQQT